MKKILVNVRYWFAPILIIVAMLGVLVGGMFSWVGLLLLGVGIVIDTAMRFQTAGAGVDENGENLGVAWLQNGVMYSMLGVFVLLQLSIAWRVYQYVQGVPISAGFDHMLFGILPYQEGITGLNLIGAAISSGIFAGIGIIYGHELAHTKGFAFVISRLMMGLSGKSHFSYAHVYNHHLELAHEDDPATSPRGRSLWRHYPLAGIGQSRFLYWVSLF
jgi:alkane 1-monooxygenase